MNTVERRRAALMGALVGDAASLGAHWIYDVGRIADLRAAHGGSAAFLPVDPAHYDGGVGYFAHGARRLGMQTQYGATLALAMAAIQRDGGFDVGAYQADFAAYFGAGGPFVGYIDRPTRGTLANIAAERTDPSGIDDDQLPALATLPAVIVTGQNVEQAICVTNDNDVARAYGAVFAVALGAVLKGAPLAQALRDAAPLAGEEGVEALIQALDTEEPDSTAYGEVTGRACHLPMAMPLAFHILARASSFEEAINRNIDAGGDSAGRSIVIGALMGAAHGVATRTGVPLAWLLKLEDGAEAWSRSLALADLAPVDGP
ncbi:ADP-ribosylglycohydrolase family protein [Oceaniglobus trochenteri]|uniref:ADP-ribosylglycohydrolase family protein n=1 Tax=Oceaniglobus trochenteri TaxID=2763260 RepID=UPI001CFFAE6C|nr:ADP-ribosylglycohydrolase family protein [Oceaniglobus trochenteri]